MTIRGQHGKRHPYSHTVLVFAVWAVIFTTALTAAGVSGGQTEKHALELRLASHEKVEGWEKVPGPGPENTPAWISPEVALTKADIARAWPERTSENKPCVGIMFTEEGALKLARLTKSHIGELLAIIVDGRVTAVPMINAEITGGRALINGNFTEEMARSFANWLSGDQAWKPGYGPGKHMFELRLASHEQVEGWERVLGPEPQFAPLWISPEVALTNVDIARAYADRTVDGKLCVGIMLTEEGALKLARLTKSHIGELLAIMLDGRVDSVPKIMDEITGGRARILGNFTEEEAGSIAKGIMMK
jgi:preprotein translocase subunit SecD